MTQIETKAREAAWDFIAAEDPSPVQKQIIEAYINNNWRKHIQPPTLRIVK